MTPRSQDMNLIVLYYVNCIRCSITTGNLPHNPKHLPAPKKSPSNTHTEPSVSFHFNPSLTSTIFFWPQAVL